MNKSRCVSCLKFVPSGRVQRDGKVFLVKECPDCGTTEALVSSDAARHFSKRELDPGWDCLSCAEVDCGACKRHRPPTYAFVDTTNRCNLNCPMCADGVRAHGFAFDPPMEYFEKVFEHLSHLDPLPTVALFGGEPTVRKDLPDIVRLARSYGLSTRVLTNGLALADEEYCRKVVESRPHLLVSYDGCRPSTYLELRRNPKVLEKKQKAIENLSKLERARVSFVTCLAWGLNDTELPELLNFYHRHRHMLHGVYLMPLVRTWSASEFDYTPDRMTTEDVERLLNDVFPDYNVEFISLGLASHFTTIAKYLGQPSLPYTGAHPNCESFYLLVSDGEKYLPVTHYIRKSLPEVAGDFLVLEKRLRAREERWKSSAFGRLLGVLRLKNFVLKLMGRGAALRVAMRNVRLRRFVKGRGLGKLGHGLTALIELALRRKWCDVRERHLSIQDALRIVILPLEDDPILETDRLERCPSSHVIYNPKTGEFRYIPVCSWRLYNKQILRELADAYADK